MIKGKYNRIVAYGCSFTAGDELADAQVLGIPENEIDELKRSGLTRKELYGRQRTDINDVSKTLSWVRWLADRYNVAYSNRAVGGGSIQQMVFRLERDLRLGHINDDDLVLVGLTSMYRWFQFDREGHELSWVFAYTKDAHDLNDKLVEYYVNEYNIIWQYYMHMNYLEMLAEKYDNIKILHAISPFSEEKEFNIRNKKMKHDFKTFIDSFKFKSLLNEKYGMGQLYTHLPKKEATHGWGHPKVKYQKEFANLLYSWIEAKL